MLRVTDPADPERCQGSAGLSQCSNRSEPGAEFCTVHGADPYAADDEERRVYHLTEARSRQRLAELAEHDPVHALNEVLSLARLAIEKRYNLVYEDADLYSAYRDLNALQLLVARIVKTAHSIEQNLGVLLGKPTVLRFGQLVIRIVAEELEGLEGYTDVVEKIADQTIQAIASANNHTEPSGIKVPSLIGRTGRDAKTFLLNDVEDQIRLAELSTHEKIKCLNDDIALQVILIERRWNMVRTDSDLISACPQLCAALRVLETQIKTAHEIEQSLGNLLTRESIQRLGGSLSQIIVDCLEDSALPDYEALTDKIMERILNTRFVPATPRIAA